MSDELVQINNYVDIKDAVVHDWGPNYDINPLEPPVFVCDVYQID